MFYLRLDHNGKTVIHVPTNRQKRIKRSHAKALEQALSELGDKASEATLVLSNLARIHPDSVGVDSWQGVQTIQEQITKMITRRGPDLHPRRINPRSLCNLRAFTKETAPRLKVTAPFEKRQQIEAFILQGLSLAVAADKVGISKGQAKYVTQGMSDKLTLQRLQNTDVKAVAGATGAPKKGGL